MEIQCLIREMSPANRLWGAPRIHGELLKLGIEVAQSTVAKYMARSGRGPSQTWKTFLRNHTAGIAATDFLIVPTIGFRLLFVLVILRHQRRRLISLRSKDAHLAAIIREAYAMRRVACRDQPVPLDHVGNRQIGRCLILADSRRVNRTIRPNRTIRHCKGLPSVTSASSTHIARARRSAAVRFGIIDIGVQT